MKNIKAILYDAGCDDQEVDVGEIDVSKLKDKQQLLWVAVSDREFETLDNARRAMKLENVPCERVVAGDKDPDLEKYGEFFRFSVDSIVTEPDAPPERLKVDFVVGKNFVITVSNGEPDYFCVFRKREKRESSIGTLDAEGLVASLLDQNVVTYFIAISEIERRVDELDADVMKKELETQDFLDQMLELRSNVSKLRRFLVPHREIYYALARADLSDIANSDSHDQFKILGQHYENAIDGIENARDTVIGLFDLFATKTTHMTNMLIQRLTFLSLLTGSLGVVAGILGMNFQSEFFEFQHGFLATVIGIAVVAIGITVFARMKRWI